MCCRILVAPAPLFHGLALHDGVDIVVLVHDGHTLPFDAAAIGFHTLTQALSSLTFFGATSFRATNLLVIGFVVLRCPT